MGPLQKLPQWLDRNLLLADETEDPLARIARVLRVVVILVTVLIELLAGAWAIQVGHANIALLHLVLALAFVALVLLLPKRSDAKRVSVLMVLGILLATALSLYDLSPTLLVWCLLAPSGLLLTIGRKSAWGALATVAGGALALSVTSEMNLLFWAVAGVVGASGFLVLAAIVLRLLEATFAFNQERNGILAEHLEASRSSELRYANQTKFLEALLDLIPFPLFSKSMDGVFLNINASFGVVFDVVPSEVIGKNNPDFLGEHNAGKLAKIELEVLARDSMAAEETKLLHPDGRMHDFIVYMRPFVNTLQSNQGYVGVLIDITDRKQKEQNLIQLNDTKDQLFRILSHDLRAPIGKMKQLLEIYIEDPGIFDRATWDTVFQDMRKTSDSLFQLLENLLSWVRNQKGEDESVFELFSLEPLVVDIFSLQKLIANEKKIELHHHIELTSPVMSDKQLLSTIIRNLVNNALKFTRIGGKVTVCAGETEHGIWVSVEDSGVGMNAETLTRIFEKHERVITYGTAKEHGQGIGLGLCLDLTTNLGGQLTAESVEGLGTKVTLRLPTTEL